MKREAEQSVADLDKEVREKQQQSNNIKLPKKKVAMIVGYNGSNYHGSQK